MDKKIWASWVKSCVQSRVKIKMNAVGSTISITNACNIKFSFGVFYFYKILHFDHVLDFKVDNNNEGKVYQLVENTRHCL